MQNNTFIQRFQRTFKIFLQNVYLILHYLSFSLDIPTGSDVHCVAGRVNIQGKLVLSYRNCNESLPVLCEVQSTEITTLSSSIPSTTTHTAGSTSTITSIGNIIVNAGNDNEKLTSCYISHHTKKNTSNIHFEPKQLKIITCQHHCAVDFNLIF